MKVMYAFSGSSFESRTLSSLNRPTGTYKCRGVTCGELHIALVTLTGSTCLSRSGRNESGRYSGSDGSETSGANPSPEPVFLARAAI